MLQNDSVSGLHYWQLLSHVSGKCFFWGGSEGVGVGGGARPKHFYCGHMEVG